MIAKLIRLAIALYPRAWRERYGEGLAATVADMPAQSWRTVWDLGRGALAMQVQWNLAHVLRSAALFGAALATLAFAVSLAIPNQYVSQAQIWAEDANPESLTRTLRETLTRNRLRLLIDQHRLYVADRRRKPIEDVIDMMRQDIRIYAPKAAENGRQGFRVGFVYADPVVAQRVTNDITQAIVEAGKSYSVADGASGGRDPIYPNRIIIALMGLTCGVLVGVLWAVLRRRPAASLLQ